MATKAQKKQSGVAVIQGKLEVATTYNERLQRESVTMPRLTTHVLDIAHGRPAAGVAVRLYRLGDGRELVTSVQTNADGRTDAPLLDSDTADAMPVELEFDIGEYFANAGTITVEPAFLDTVVIRVTLAPDEGYHVPLLASPWSYSTYRGS